MKEACTMSIKAIQSLDLVGIGFGPANIAIAAMLDDQKKNIQCLFLDKKEYFHWHTGMVIPEGQLQVPFFRDLALLRNPQSPYTFLNYLKEKNRLDAFINLRTFYPTRVEYQDYLTWASHKLSRFVQFNCQVQTLTPVWNGKNITHFNIQGINVTTQELFCLTTSRVIVSPGSTIHLPDCAKNLDDERVIHTSHFIMQTPKVFSNKEQAYHFVVVGSGQSASEVVLHLMNNYPNAKISFCFRKGSLHSCDSNPFVNAMYHQESISTFYGKKREVKDTLLKELRNSNYSVIDSEILSEIYRKMYIDYLNGRRSLVIESLLQLHSIETNNKFINLEFFDLSCNQIKIMKADGIILATGYTNHTYKELFTEIDPYIEKDQYGEYVISENYEIQTDDVLKAQVYLQGCCEKSHGPSDQTLSVLSTRAEIIVNAMWQEKCV